MNKNRSFRVIVKIIIVLAIIMGNQNLNWKNVYATNVKEVRYKSFDMGSDIVFKGVFSSHSLYFNIDKHMLVNSAEANIVFNITQLVDNSKEATITFLLNDVPFSSSRLVHKTNEENQNIKVSIPLRLMKEGSNEFKISAYCRISDDPCKDDNNNANWLVVDKSSSILINFNDKEVINHISEFPYPFIKTNELKENNTAIVIPDDCKESELTAAFILQAYLGKLYKDDDYNGTIVKYSDMPRDKDIIYIGGDKDLPQEIKNLYSDARNDNYNEVSIIKTNKSPFNENNILLSVVCDNEDILMKSIRLLCNKELVSQLNVDTFKVNKDVKEETTNVESKVKLTLNDLGVGDLNLKGNFRQSASIAYKLPRNRAVANGSKVKLNVRYSDNLDFQRSLLTIYVNGVPIGSKKLEKDKCNGDELELSIPLDVKISNYIDIKVAFDLETVNSYCQFRQEEMPWAFVSNDSFLYLPNLNLKSFIFDLYSNPFITDNKFNNTAIVIPDQLSQNELDGLSRMVSYMGRDVDYNNGILKVIKSGNFSEKYYNMNLIIYGTPDNNKLVKEINNNLWFKYKDGFKEFEGNEKLYLTSPYAGNIANFQFDVSSYNSRNAMLILTSPKSELNTKALKYLYSSKETFKMRGDCVLIDESGNLKTFKFKKDDSGFNYDKIKMADKSVKMFMTFMAMFSIFLVVAAILYYLKNKSFKYKDKNKDKK